MSANQGIIDFICKSAQRHLGDDAVTSVAIVPSVTVVKEHSLMMGDLTDFYQLVLQKDVNCVATDVVKAGLEFLHLKMQAATDLARELVASKAKEAQNNQENQGNAE